MNRLKFKLFFWYFCHVKVPMIGYLKPHLIKLTSQEILVCLPLRRRSRNHLNSMYFGALAVGADLAAGLHGFYHAELANAKISLVFKSFTAQFLKRPETDVYFYSSEGEKIKKMIEKTLQTGGRINQPIEVSAYLDPQALNPIAHFQLELSIKKN